ncbi:MAG: CDP-diacylglycerol--glycerol-3-phosphate 3-phosphatidyltransferase [Treponemataceae bacterium]
MTMADKVTAVRLILAPFFFLVFFLPDWLPIGPEWTAFVLWFIFIVSEITDLIDGKIARSRNEVSDFGKLFDPFADTLVRITYFLCFVVEGILPAFLFAIVLYREFGILFLRTLMMRRGIAMGARSGGKIKAVMYMVTGVVALLAVSVQRLGFDSMIFRILKWTSIGIFSIAVVLAVTSFVDYLRVFKNSSK